MRTWLTWLREHGYSFDRLTSECALRWKHRHGATVQLDRDGTWHCDNREGNTPEEVLDVTRELPGLKLRYMQIVPGDVVRCDFCGCDAAIQFVHAYDTEVRVDDLPYLCDECAPVLRYLVEALALPAWTLAEKGGER